MQIMDTLQNGQAGAIEITPEMIEAGARILEGQVFPYGAVGDEAERLAKAVFEGMFCVSLPARPHSG